MITRVKRVNVRNVGETKQVSIPMFNSRLWNVFAGRCKARNQNIREVLETILTAWIRSEEGSGN